MENPFLTNSFYLLGLPVTATQSEIKRKGKLISAQLGIGEDSIEEDLPFLRPVRNEDTLKDALQKLTNPIKRIQEAYLWYSDEEYDDLLKTLKEGYLEEAEASLAKKGAANGKWNAKRDRAILLTQLLLSKRSFKKYLQVSLDTWKELLESESSWKYFQLYYQNSDDLSTDTAAFSGLREWVESQISDLYSELGEKWADKEYSYEYTRTFGKASSGAVRDVLAPNAKRINEASESLNTIKWADKAASKENIAAIKDNIAAIQESLNELAENGLYEESKVITLRDKASDAIRSVAVDLNNKFNDYERSAKILLIAEEISGTISTKTRNKGERDTIEDNLTSQKFLVPVMELQNKGKFRQAVELIENQIKKNGADPKTSALLTQQLQNAKRRYVIETRSAALDKLNGKDFSGATGMYNLLRTYISQNMDDLGLNESSTHDVIGQIDDKTKLITKNNFSQLFDDRDNVVKMLFEHLGQTDEAAIFMCLIDCAYYSPISEYLDMTKNKNGVLSVLFKLGWWLLLVYGIGLLFLIPAYIWQAFEVKYVRE